MSSTDTGESRRGDTSERREVTPNMIDESTRGTHLGGINVWNSPCREHVVCVISSSDTVTILGRETCSSDGNPVYHIETSSGCRGYVSTIQLD
jgi:hypothetical protein